MDISEITTSTSPTNGDVDNLTTQIENLDTQEPKHRSLLESSYEVKVTSVDDEPLLSVTKFEELNLSPNLLKGIYEMGFTTPSKIQAKALPLLLKSP
ncbi:4872_t:CDS:2, partial [Dentiscutata heterogama]